jgi:RNA polymerase sigma-70 factor (ECF subfamily)
MPWSSHNESARGCAEQIERWLEPLHRTALRLTGNRADAEDLVQETCLRACRGWAEVRDQTRTRGWFFQVLRRAWLDQLRKAARRPRLVPMEQETAYPSFECPPLPKVTDAAERRALEEGFDEEVLAAMNELPEGERLALMFQVFGGLNYREISEALACPLGTVMSRLHRARVSLRLRLADYAVRQGIIPRFDATQEDESHA